jgi:hypothetical protein
VYAKFEEFIERNRQQVEEGPVFEFSELTQRVDSIDSDMRQRVWEAVQDGRSGYVKGFPGRYRYTWNVD